jgi:hypothetical protein
MGEYAHTHKHKNIHKHVFTDIIIFSTEPSKIQRKKLHVPQKFVSQ